MKECERELVEQEKVERRKRAMLLAQTQKSKRPESREEDIEVSTSASKKGGRKSIKHKEKDDIDDHEELMSYGPGGER